MKKWIIAVVLVAAVLGGGYFVSTNLDQKNEASPVSTQEVKKIKASVEIDSGGEEKSPSKYSVEVEEGKTVLDATNKVADVATSGEGEMAFVTSINDRVADSSKNEFWELVINGESAQVGAGGYKIQDGDKIEWRISQF